MGQQEPCAIQQGCAPGKEESLETIKVQEETTWEATLGKGPWGPWEPWEPVANPCSRGGQQHVGLYQQEHHQELGGYGCPLCPALAVRTHLDTEDSLFTHKSPHPPLQERYLQTVASSEQGTDNGWGWSSCPMRRGWGSWVCPSWGRGVSGINYYQSACIYEV